jgi:hypothetical protein
VGRKTESMFVPSLLGLAYFRVAPRAYVRPGLRLGVMGRNELLGQFYGQLGLGLPLFHGFMVIEPYARLMHVFADTRANSELGFDVTFAL